jgi:tight adherence protein B
MLAIGAILFFLAMFLVVAIAVVVAWMILQRRAYREAGEQPTDSSSDSTPSSPLLKDEQLSTISLWGALLAQFDYVEIMKTRIAQAGLKWSVGRVTAMMLLSGTVVLALIMDISFIPAYVVLIASASAGLTPYFYILHKRAKRLNQFEQQFPEALDFLSRALRAGHPFVGSLEMLANESAAPLSAEMRRTFEEINLGMPIEQALGNLARRVPLLDVSVFAAAVKLHSRTGGKLTEVMGNLSETMRESMDLRGEVRSLAAQGRLTGRILTLLPLFIVLVMAYVNPNYLTILTDHPRGKDLIAAAVISLVVAHFVIRKIVDIRL